MRSDETRLLDIPRSRQIIAIIYPHHDTGFKDFPGSSTQDVETFLVVCISVVRVRPRTFKEHHRPGIGSRLNAFGKMHNPNK